MRNFDPISPLIGPVQRVDAGDFFGLRKEYRRCALRTLRQREGYRAPVFVNGRWMFLGDDRKYHCQAVGHRKQPSVELVDDFWGGSNAPFETLNYVGGVGAGLSALSGVMGNVPGMSSIASPSALASGISNLPGGQSAISSIVNSSSLTTTGVSDTLSGLGSITKNASSAALNQISSATSGSSSLSGLLSGGALTGAGSALNGALTNPSSLLNGAAGSIPNIPGLPSVSGLPSVDSLTKGLQSGKQSLSSLVSTGISPAAAAALTASMNSLSTSSPFPVKMPTVAEKTVDRSEVSSQINNLLGDKKVPSPNYSGTIAPAATGSYQSYDDRLLAVEKYSAERKVITDAQQALYDKARAAYDDASQTLPQGDPELHKLAQVAITEGKKLLAIKQETYDGRLAILTA